MKHEKTGDSKRKRGRNPVIIKTQTENFLKRREGVKKEKKGSSFSGDQTAPRKRAGPVSVKTQKKQRRTSQCSWEKRKVAQHRISKHIGPCGNPIKGKKTIANERSKLEGRKKVIVPEIGGS